jgi:hypothetical protein
VRSPFRQLIERQLENVRENDGTPSFTSDHIIDRTLPDMPDGLLITGLENEVASRPAFHEVTKHTKVAFEPS